MGGLKFIKYLKLSPYTPQEGLDSLYNFNKVLEPSRIQDPMKHYHELWLAAHPNRTWEWLQDRLKDGFSIHHVDGDAWNNEADNLVLIESVDHLMLHSGKRVMPRGAAVRPRKRVILMPDGAMVTKKRGESARVSKVLHENGMLPPARYVTGVTANSTWDE